VAGTRGQETGAPRAAPASTRQMRWTTRTVEPPIAPAPRHALNATAADRMPATDKPPLPGRMAVGARPPEPMLRSGPALARPLQEPNRSRGQVGDLVPAEVAAIDRRPSRVPTTGLRVDGNVIVYRPKTEAASVRKARKQPRRQARRPRDIYETSWARQAFGTGD
jgi:hypothetical protein